MSADEFRLLAIGKTEKEATSQNNIIYKVLAHARMVAADLKEGFRSILDKLAVLRRDPRIQFMMQEWTADSPPLEHIIAQLVGQILSEAGANQDIRILDISGLPNEVG